MVFPYLSFQVEPGIVSQGISFVIIIFSYLLSKWKKVFGALLFGLLIGFLVMIFVIQASQGFMPNSCGTACVGNNLNYPYSQSYSPPMGQALPMYYPYRQQYPQLWNNYPIYPYAGLPSQATYAFSPYYFNFGASPYRQYAFQGGGYCPYCSSLGTSGSPPSYWQMYGPQVNIPGGGGAIAKPVIYLYPTRKRVVDVKLHFTGDLLFTYPSYDKSLSGWRVVADPSGKLVDMRDNSIHYYLFWEGSNNIDQTQVPKTGFVVAGADVVTFFIKTLSKMGLNSREYNDFITYWAPKMQNNRYNFIRFIMNEDYEKVAMLDVNPRPDSVLRFIMIFNKLDKYIDNVEPQEIPSFKRKGFSVIEWGGTEFYN